MNNFVRKNKLISIWLLFIVLFTLSIAATSMYFLQLPFCHAMQKEGGLTPGSPIFSPDGKKIAFLGYVLVSRPPVGICTFPDGGGHLITRNEMHVYVTDVQSSSPRLISEIPIASQNGLSSEAHRLFGWEDNEVYLWTYYPNDGSGKRHYLRVNIDDGHYMELSDNAGKILEERFWGQLRFNPIDNSQWVDYDNGAKIIGIYTGGKLQMDNERKSVFQSGNPPTVLIKTIVNESMVKNLQPILE